MKDTQFEIDDQDEDQEVYETIMESYEEEQEEIDNDNMLGYD